MPYASVGLVIVSGKAQDALDTGSPLLAGKPSDGGIFGDRGAWIMLKRAGMDALYMAAESWRDHLGNMSPPPAVAWAAMIVLRLGRRRPSR